MLCLKQALHCHMSFHPELRRPTGLREYDMKKSFLEWHFFGKKMSGESKQEKNLFDSLDHQVWWVIWQQTK